MDTVTDDHLGTVDRAIDAHLAICPMCAEFERVSLQTRRVLRFEDAVDEAAGENAVTAQVLEAVSLPRPVEKHTARRPAGSLAVIALFVLCASLSFGVMRVSDGVGPADAAERASLVARGQAAVRSLDAKVTLSERGGSGSVTVRRAGTLTYVAPEAVVLRLDGEGGPIEVGVNGESAWRTGTGQSAVTGREPFDTSGWSPLELIVPFDAFGRDTAGTIDTRLGDQPAKQVVTTVAQVDELLGALRTGDGWRPLHPSDVVTLWLDASTAVPMRIEVSASTDPDRASWAARHALSEPHNGPLFVAELHDVVLNDASATVSAPPAAADRGLGFVDRTVGDGELPTPSWLPASMVAYRSGERRTPGSDRSVVVRTWTNGRAWLKVRATREWDGDRLFGDIGPLVRPISTTIGTVYGSADGTSIAIHGDSIDAVVTGSLPERDLLRVAASLGVEAREVPSWWQESAARTVAQLDRASRPVLVPAADVPAGVTAVAVAQDRVDVSVVGPGARGVRVVELGGTPTVPAEDPDARAVRVRGVDGRFSPMLGELTWHERDQLVIVSSRSYTLPELLVFADAMRWT